MRRPDETVRFVHEAVVDVNVPTVPVVMLALVAFRVVAFAVVDVSVPTVPVVMFALVAFRVAAFAVVEVSVPTVPVVILAFVAVIPVELIERMSVPSALNT